MCTSAWCRKRSSTRCGRAKRRTTAYALSRTRTRKTKERNDVGTSFDDMESDSIWRELLQDVLRHDDPELSSAECVEALATPFHPWHYLILHDVKQLDSESVMTDSKSGPFDDRSHRAKVFLCDDYRNRVPDPVSVSFRHSYTGLDPIDRWGSLIEDDSLYVSVTCGKDENSFTHLIVFSPSRWLCSEKDWPVEQTGSERECVSVLVFHQGLSLDLVNSIYFSKKIYKSVFSFWKEKNWSLMILPLFKLNIHQIREHFLVWNDRWLSLISLYSIKMTSNLHIKLDSFLICSSLHIWYHDFQKKMIRWSLDDDKKLTNLRYFIYDLYGV